MSICPRCKREFPKRGNKIYCSRKCKVKAKDKRTGRCYRHNKERIERRKKEGKFAYRENAYRKIILSFLGNKCSKCGDNKKLHIHHIIPIFLGGTNDCKNITLLCEKCHSFLHLEQYL